MDFFHYFCAMRINIHTHNPDSNELTLSTIGFHPYDAESVTEQMLVELEQKAEVCSEAIGEIGLDYVCNTNRQNQTALFIAQLEIAQRYSKGVVLHCVKSFEDVMKILKNYSLRFVIFHGFIGSTEQALKATERGYYLSFGERTFRSPKTIEAMKAIPIEQLFLENDNSTIPISEIYNKAAEILSLPPLILEYITHENYDRICG